MKLKVAFYNEKILWAKNWIFLGNSYSKLKFAEKKINSFKGSKIVQVLEKNKCKLVNWTLEKGFKEIPDSYKSIFRKI